MSHWTGSRIHKVNKIKSFKFLNCFDLNRYAIVTKGNDRLVFAALASYNMAYFSRFQKQLTAICSVTAKESEIRHDARRLMNLNKNTSEEVIWVVSMAFYRVFLVDHITTLPGSRIFMQNI